MRIEGFFSLLFCLLVIACLLMGARLLQLELRGTLPADAPPAASP